MYIQCIVYELIFLFSQHIIVITNDLREIIIKSKVHLQYDDMIESSYTCACNYNTKNNILA